MFDRVVRLRDEIRSLLGELEPETVDAREAKALVEVFAELERLVVAGKTLCVRRVAASAVWAEAGDRSAAHWLARTSGTTVGAAVGVVQTARRLGSLPDTEDAFKAGSLSAVQADEVAAAASADPFAESALLDAAFHAGVRGLRETCRNVKAAAATDERERYDRIHRSRSLRHWTDHDGAFHLDARLTPDAGARVLAALEPHRARIVSEARAARRHGSPEAFAADALVALVESKAGTRPAAVQIRVDHSAFVRGRVDSGEVCEIPGIGTLPVAVARHLAEDAVLTAVVTDGVDVRTIARIDRTIPVPLRTALEAREPSCGVEGCDERDHPEIDHVVPFAEGGPTSLDNLARLCRWHHQLKTHRGYRLLGPPGHRQLVPPPVSAAPRP